MPSLRFILQKRLFSTIVSSSTTTASVSSTSNCSTSLQYQRLMAIRNADHFLRNVIPEQLQAASQLASNSANISYWQTLLHNSKALQLKQNEIAQLDSLLANTNDSELIAIANDERSTLCAQLDHLSQRFIDAALPLDQFDRLTKCQLELNAGVGGVEAMLFSAELLDMYQHYASFNDWTWSVMHQDNAQLGGLRSALIAVSGPLVYSKLRFEAGVHRVQRVPITDKSRIHTSTASVSVLPEPEKVDAYVKSSDCKIEAMRASGPGGQNVNKRSTAVRVTHKPTGISVHCMDERFQYLNIQIAYRRLAAILMQQQLDRIEQQTSTARRLQVGSKARAEKVRTYNFKDDRITDHRLRNSWSGIQAVMSGHDHLDEIIRSLQNAHKIERLEEIFNSNSHSS